MTVSIILYCSILLSLLCAHSGYSVQGEHLSSELLTNWTNNFGSGSDGLLSSDAAIFHQLALIIFKNHQRPTTNMVSSTSSLKKGKVPATASWSTPYKRVHLIRVPKASSTSLSVVARRLVGCEPPGPCCKYPGDPPGTCPDARLFECEFQHKVIGCTGHHGNNIALRTSSMKSIMIIRNPISRSLSAFHYPGIHHNSDCNGEKWTCFEEYLRSRRWSNVVIKMLVGDFAYANAATCFNSTSECSRSLELAEQNLMKLHFLGVAEMWELSMLLLHLKFPHLHPLLEEFAMTSSLSSSSNHTSNNISSSTSTIAMSEKNREQSRRQLMLKKTVQSSTTSQSHSISNIQRVNHDSAYRSFVTEANKRYKTELTKQNQLDMVIYSKVLELMCKEVQALGLWEIPYVQSYWHKKMKDVSCPSIG